MQDFDFQPFKVLLVLTNFVVLGCLLVLIAIHVKSQYNLKSFSFLFYLFSLAWLCIRGVFWIATLNSSVEWTSAEYYLLYWMPVPLEVASFMLLPLYFAQILYPDEWKKYYGTGRRLYIAFVVSLTAGQLIYIMMELVSENEKVRNCGAQSCLEIDTPNLALRAISATCFLGLSAVLSIYASKLHTVAKHRYDRFLTYSPEVMYKVNCVLLVSFLSRSLYQILAATGLYVLPDVKLSVDGDATVAVFVFFELWDYVPTILLLSTISSGSLGSAQTQRNTNINKRSRELLGHAPYSTYGSVAASSEDVERALLSGATAEEDGAEGAGGERDQAGVEMAGTGHRRDSRSSQDIAFERAVPSDAAEDRTANLLLNRYITPQSLDRNDSSLLAHDSSRYWRIAASPSGSGSKSGSYNGPSTTQGMSTYASRHSQDPSAWGDAPAVSESSPREGQLSASVPTGPGQHHLHRGMLPTHQPCAPASLGTSLPSGSLSSTGSQLERNESLVAYYSKHRRSNSIGTYDCIAEGSSESDSPRPGSLTGRMGQMGQSSPAASERGSQLLKNSLSPKSPFSPKRGARSVDAAESGPGRALSPGSGSASPITPPRERREAPRMSARDEVAAAFLLPAPMPTRQNSLPAQPSVANEWQVEPNLPRSQSSQPNAREYRDAYGQYGQHALTPGLEQEFPQSQPMIPMHGNDGYQQAQVAVGHVHYVRSPVQPHPRSPALSGLNVRSPPPFVVTNSQGQVMMPVSLSPVHLVPVYSQQSYATQLHALDQSGDSLTFSQDSPGMQSVDSYGPPGASRYPYAYDDQYLVGSYTNSTFSDGIGMGNFQSNSGSVGNTFGRGPTAPQGTGGSRTGSPALRTLQPRPQRPAADPRTNFSNYGVTSPTSNSGENARYGNYPYDPTVDGNASFSPSIILGLGSERDSYLQQQLARARSERSMHSRSRSGGAGVSTPDRQEAARENARIRGDHRRDKD